jgi:hypothetical protein
MTSVAGIRLAARAAAVSLHEWAAAKSDLKMQ